MYAVKCAALLAAIQQLASASPIITRQDAPVPNRFLFAFGDSYTATGFEANGTQPNVENPMGNPIIGTPRTVPGFDGSYTLGRNYVGYLTTEMNTTWTYTFDFAHGLATVDDGIVAAQSPEIQSPEQVPSFEEQITRFVSRNDTTTANIGSWNYTDATPWNQDNSFFIVFFGINDLLNTFMTRQMNESIPLVIERYSQLVDTMYEVGARRFLFVNVPPLSRSPFAIQEAGEQNTFDDWANEYNRELAQVVDTFNTSNNDTEVAFYDFFSFFSEVLDNAEEYGFQNATCVGDVENCIWSDAIHTTATLNEIMAVDMLPTLEELGW